MFYIGIDPSFTRTGLAVVERDVGVFTLHEAVSISAPKLEDDIYQIDITLRSSRWLAVAIMEQLDKWLKEYDITAICIEFPVLRTESGAYLALIQQALYERYDALTVPVYGVSANAIGSLTKTHNKARLIAWGLQNFKFNTARLGRTGGRINHDEYSGAVLAIIASKIDHREYEYVWKEFHKPIKHGKTKRKLL